MRSVLFGMVLAALAGVAAPAAAQDFPSRPVTMIIPFAAGGPTDVLGRIVGARMSEVLGQQVVIENVGGAGGMTGAARVAQSAPDGYTIGLGTVGTHAQGQSLYKKPLYNAATDFTPVALTTPRWAPASRMCPIAAPARRCRTCKAAASTSCARW